MCIRWSWLMVASAIAAAANPVWAQETGSISGRLTDPSGAPLPGVAVTIDGSLIPAFSVYSQANGVYRFPAIPPGGDYSLSFGLEGFATVLHEGLHIRLGGDTQVDVGLEVTGVIETIEVSGQAPIIDVKDSGTGASVTEHYMQSIPSARDPWVMVAQISGTQTSVNNVGGSHAGSQQVFTAFGSKFEDTIWTYDGVSMNDPAAKGGVAMYFDFDALEEISISTGGNDPSIETGGIRLNFVSKRGGNVWRGSSRFYITPGEWQSHTVGDPLTGELVGNYTEEELWPGYVGNSIDNNKDFGVEVGGPIVRDKLFIWGAYGRQLINLFVGTTPVNSQITNWHAKANWHISDSLVANFTFLHANKAVQNRGASVYLEDGATWNQDGPNPIYTFKLQLSASDNDYLEATLNYMRPGFELVPVGGFDTQMATEWTTYVTSRTRDFFYTERTSTNVRLNGNSYLAGARVDHELKYGYSFRAMEASSLYGLPQGVALDFNGGVAFQAALQQDAADNFSGVRHGVYAGDTISAGRFTVNLGLRYDYQTSESLPSSVPSLALAPDLFPSVTFEGFDPGFSWKALSPRLGVTYLTNSARTLLRFNAARYNSQLPIGEFHRTGTTGGNYIYVEWSDPNGNGLLDAGEVGDMLWAGPGWDPENPNAPSPNQMFETTPPWTDELIVGVEHEINRSFGIGANLIYKRHGNFTWAPRAGEDDPAFWEPVTQDIDGYGEVVVYQPVEPRAFYTVYKQRPNYGRTYRGIELTLDKRYANRWMANASFVYGNNVENFEGPGGFTDPTNIVFQDGRPLGLGTRFGTWNNSRWNLKASGMVELGAGFQVAGFAQAREGGINVQTVRSNPRAYAGRVHVFVEDYGETRIPTFWSVDLRAEKNFDLGRRGRLHLILDVFNVTNNDTILGQEGRTESIYYGRITEVLQGRVIRLGVRMVLQ